MPPKKTTTAKKEINPLTQGIANLEKTFKGEFGAVDLDPNQFKKPRPHLSTGSVVIDYMIGGRPNAHGVPPCPGLPRGAITEIWGHEGAGKTTVALTAAAKTCRNGSKSGGPGTVIYVDWEHAVDLAYAKTIGVPVDDPNRFRIVQPATLEQGLGVIWTMTKAGVDLVVIDSIGAGIPEIHLKQKDDEKGDLGRVGLLAAKWSKVLPELSQKAAETGTTILGISQLRKKISKGPSAGYGPDTAPQGGEAWKFYSWVRFGLRRVMYEKGKLYDPLTHTQIETAVSSLVQVKLEKCKVSSSQGREGQIRISFGEGIDDFRSVLDIAAAHKIIKKEGAWYSFQPTGVPLLRTQGLDKLRAAIKEAPGAPEELYQQVFNKLNSMSEGLSLATEEEEDEADLSDLDAILNDSKPVEVEGKEDFDE
jgi:recombination protein RecA